MNVILNRKCVNTRPLGDELKLKETTTGEDLDSWITAPF